MKEQKSEISGKVKLLTLEMCVGLFFFTALLILIYYTALVRGDNLFSSKIEHKVKIRFSDISSLAVNDKVFLRGMPIGKVKTFNIEDNNEKVIVTLALDRIISFHDGYLVAVRSSSLLGGKYIYINPGNIAGEAVAPGTILTGKDSIDILNQMSSLIASLREDEKIFREKVLEGDVLDGINEAAGVLKEMAESIKSGKGVLGKLMKDETLYDDTLKALAKIDKAADNISAVFADIKDGKGAIGKMMQDEAVYKDLKSAISDIKKVTADIAGNKGSLGKIMNDDGKLYDNLLSTVESTKIISQQLAEGKGSFGKLIFEDELYRETKETILQLKGAVEDFREQAPIATFGSMAFGAL